MKRRNVEFSLGFGDGAAGVVLGVILFVRAELCNVAHDFFWRESARQGSLRRRPSHVPIGSIPEGLTPQTAHEMESIYQGQNPLVQCEV